LLSSTPRPTFSTDGVIGVLSRKVAAPFGM
jgi:hypothetical protein